MGYLCYSPPFVKKASFYFVACDTSTLVIGCFSCLLAFSLGIRELRHIVGNKAYLYKNSKAARFERTFVILFRFKMKTRDFIT